MMKRVMACAIFAGLLVGCADGDAPDFAGQGTDTLMESWIFSGNEPVVKHVFVGGRQVIKDGMHPAEKEIARRYRDTVTRLLSD